MINYLKEKFPRAIIQCAYEAGFSGFSLQEELTQAGIECLVVHPADIPTTNKEPEFKTDKRDAKKNDPGRIDLGSHWSGSSIGNGIPGIKKKNAWQQSHH